MTRLAYARVEGIPFFSIPPTARPMDGVGAVTGGGWMAAISPARGLYNLEDASGAVRLTDLRGGQVDELPWQTRGGPGGWIGSGAWGRSLAGGGEERGVLLDGLPVVVIQQRQAEAGDPVTHLVMGDHLSAAVVRSVTQGLLSRVSGRLARGAQSEGMEPGFSLTGWPATTSVAEAREVLVQLLLNPPELDLEVGDKSIPQGLLGVDGEGVLHRLTGEMAHEVALGALMAGEVALAERLFPLAFSEPPSKEAGPVAGRLLFAAAWATWTGRVERLRPLGPLLFSWVDALEASGIGGTAPPLPSSLPSSDRLMTLLADALEPLGDQEAVRFLRERAEALRVTPRPVQGGGRQLPVLGVGEASASTARALPPRPPEAQLPPLEAFSHPHHPTARHRAALHAARIIRSAVEGVLGVVPDAAWGRLRLAPDLTQVPKVEDGVRTLRLEGLRVGDAQVRLTCRMHEGHCTLAVAQVGGRVPLNLVFEPRLPLRTVERVEMGDEAVQVQILEDGNGTRVRLQFPLDPERKIKIYGESREEQSGVT